MNKLECNDDTYVMVLDQKYLHVNKYLVNIYKRKLIAYIGTKSDYKFIMKMITIRIPVCERSHKK